MQVPQIQEESDKIDTIQLEAEIRPGTSKLSADQSYSSLAYKSSRKKSKDSRSNNNNNSENGLLEENIELLDKTKKTSLQTDTHQLKVPGLAAKKEVLLNGAKKMLSRENSTSGHDLYIELELLHYTENELFYDSNGELSNYHWKIVSRWIKYEQTIDPETNIWSKPFVGALVYQNLVYLKNTLQYGTIILNSLKETFESIIDDVLHDFCMRGHMSRDNKDRMKGILLSQHRSQIGVAGVLTGKKIPISELFSSNWRQSTRRMTSSGNSSVMINDAEPSALRKSSSYFNRQMSMAMANKGAVAVDEVAASSHLHIDEKKRSPSKLFASQMTTDSSVDNNMSSQFISQQKSRRSTFNMIRNSIIPHAKTPRANLSMMEDVEVCLIMVGVVDFLDRPVMAFVKLTNDQYIDHFIEYQIKVRFMFICLGPSNDSIDYQEVGRCMGTLMADKDFHDLAYNAKKRQDIIRGISQFSSKSLCLVLPLGEFDDDLLTPIIEWMKKKNKAKLAGLNGRHGGANSVAQTQKNLDKFNLLTGKKDVEAAVAADGPLEVHKEYDPFKRTGRPFGSLYNEIKYRYKKYASDIKDGFNIHCFIATVFVFTVCIAPALCFGGILADKTDQWFGLNEMLLATSINGVFFSLFSGQPLLIFGPTGPFVVFEEMLYNICVKMFCIEFFATRCWISIWILIFTITMLAFESIFVINYVTRFTEEIFAILIACVFLADAIKKIIDYLKQNPILKADIYCDLLKNKTKYNASLAKSPMFIALSDISSENETLVSAVTLANNGSTTSQRHKTAVISLPKCMMYDSNDSYYSKLSQKVPEPNIALISISLLIGTCALALILKKLRRSPFFGSYIRRTLSDVGILISICLIVLVDFLIERKTKITTQKLDIPEELVPTNKFRKSWFVSPFGNNYENSQNFPLWVPLASIFPAFIIFIVLFFEVELTSIILFAKQRKLKKGTGFNLDLLLGAIMMTFNSFLGLPWLCAAPVNTLAHWASLSIYSNSIIPGEKPKLVKVLEQRMTNIFVHIAIGLCLKGKFLLRMIPVPALFGIILYFGIVSLSGTQLYERIKFVFIPYKYLPNLPHANGLRPSKRNIFTLIQIAAVASLLTLKSYANISFIFPVVLVLLVPFRRFILPRFFTSRELEQLDDECEHHDDTVHDFYELTHMPI